MSSNPTDVPQQSSKGYQIGGNQALLGQYFNWFDVPDIDEQNIFYMAQKLGLVLNNEDVWVKSNWTTYKQYTVFTVQTKELFHIKRIWENYFVREVLALHLATHVLDPDLFVFNYLAGTYRAGFWRWKAPTPYLMTTFIRGDDIEPNFKRDPNDALWYWLGRHYYLHLILNLYDVENRHFKLAHDDGTVKRLDLGLAFFHLDRPYDGYQEYFGALQYYDNALFQQGLHFEKEMVSMHLTATRPKFLHTMQGFMRLREDDLVDFNPNYFCQALKIYWEKNIPELRLHEGW